MTRAGDVLLTIDATDDAVRALAGVLYEKSLEDIGFAGLPPPSWEELQTGVYRDVQGQPVPPSTTKATIDYWLGMARAALDHLAGYTAMAGMTGARAATLLAKLEVSYHDTTTDDGTPIVFASWTCPHGDELFGINRLASDDIEAAVLRHQAEHDVAAHWSGSEELVDVCPRCGGGRVGFHDPTQGPCVRCIRCFVADRRDGKPPTISGTSG